MEAVTLYAAGQRKEAIFPAKGALELADRALGSDHPLTLRSANRLGVFYGKLGQFDRAETLLRRTLVSRERIFGVDASDTLTSVNDLGVLYLDQGRYDDADRLLTRAFEMRERAPDLNVSDTLNAVNSLGRLRASQGQYHEAEKLLKRAVESREKILGANFASTLTAVADLGNLYVDLGRFEEAEPLLRRSVDAQARTIGETHPDTLNAQHNIANLYERQGRYSEAQQILIAVLSASEQVLGKNHPDTINAESDLAGVYASQGRYVEAEILYIRAHEAFEQTLGADSPNTLVLIQNLGTLYTLQGRYAEAEPLFLRALEASERALGEDHPNTLACINNLAGLYDRQGRYSDAEPLYQRALEARERTLGVEHLDTITSMNNLGYLFSLQGRFSEVEPLYLRVNGALERKLGAAHPYTMSSTNNLGFLYFRQGRFGEAEPLFRRALEMRSNILGPEHPDTLNSVNNLAAMYHAQGLFREVEPLMVKLLEASERALGAEHPETLRAMHNLGEVYRALGRATEAEALIAQALERRERILGSDHPDTLISANGLGNLYASQGLFSDAEPLFVATLQARERTLGPDHPDTLVSVNNLALYTELQRGAGVALPLFIRALEAANRTQSDLSIDRAIFLGNLGWLYHNELDRSSLGIFYLKQSVNVLQAMRANMSELEDGSQAAFLKKNGSPYEILQSALIDQGRFSEAALVGRMLKEEEFYEFIRRRAGEEGDPRETVIAFTASESDWARRMDEWRERPNRVAREYNALFEERSRVLASDAVWSEQDEARLQQASVALNEANAAFNAKLDELGQELTVLASDKNGQMSREIAALNAQAADAYSAALDHDGPRTALLQLLALEDATHLLFITPDAVVHEEVPIKRDELNKMIFAARDTPGIGEPAAAGAADLPAIQSQLGALYDILIKPMKPHLEDAGIEVLLIDAQGAIRYVPFAALHDGKQYLGENYLLALHSAAALTDYGRTAPKFTQASAFGVTLAHDGFDPLPSVGAEIEALVPGVDGVGIVSGLDFLDDRFTRISLEGNLGQGEILHVATHYRMNPGNETKSQLLLGDGNFLTPADIRDSQAFKRLRSVDLVTLSACETALTDQGVGAEVEGIGNVMQRKGANTVIATLWAVSDDSTADFMTTFYTELLREGQTKADALQAAQAKLIKSEDHAAPYYWAPYIIMGNWR
ncbi:MAG: tetratricopeptide repeat protein [Rhodospirillales bacterium]